MRRARGELVKARQLATVLSAYRFDCSTERSLQAGIEMALVDVQHEREKRLGPNDRPDFMVGGTVLEVKIGGSLSALIRQIHRYAKHNEVAEVLVVTSKLRLTNLPDTINGKPVHVIGLTPGI